MTLPQGESKGQLDELAVLASGLAHELRHPLNAVRFTLASLRARLEKMGPPELRKDAVEIVQEIKEDMTKLEEIVDSFLRFARPEERKPEPVDLREVARAVARFLRADLANRGMDIRLEMGEDPVVVNAPEINLRHVIMNLVLNAAEASEKGGYVVIRALEAADRGVAEVEDLGTGIPARDAERVFEPFFSTKEGGSGLGLAICRRLVSDAGGEIAYRPANPKGSVFSIAFPLAEEGAPKDDPTD